MRLPCRVPRPPGPKRPPRARQASRVRQARWLRCPPRGCGRGRRGSGPFGCLGWRGCRGNDLRRGRRRIRRFRRSGDGFHPGRRGIRKIRRLGCGSHGFRFGIRLGRVRRGGDLRFGIRQSRCLLHARKKLGFLPGFRGRLDTRCQCNCLTGRVRVLRRPGVKSGRLDRRRRDDDLLLGEQHLVAQRLAQGEDPRHCDRRQVDQADELAVRADLGLGLGAAIDQDLHPRACLAETRDQHETGGIDAHDVKARNPREPRLDRAGLGRVGCGVHDGLRATLGGAFGDRFGRGRDGGRRGVGRTGGYGRGARVQDAGHDGHGDQTGRGNAPPDGNKRELAHRGSFHLCRTRPACPCPMRQRMVERVYHAL